MAPLVVQDLRFGVPFMLPEAEEHLRLLLQAPAMVAVEIWMLPRILATAAPAS
jgi:hypothetical protein